MVRRKSTCAHCTRYLRRNVPAIDVKLQLASASVTHTRDGVPRACTGGYTSLEVHSTPLAPWQALSPRASVLAAIQRGLEQLRGRWRKPRRCLTSSEGALGGASSSVSNVKGRTTDGSDVPSAILDALRTVTSPAARSAPPAPKSARPSPIGSERSIAVQCQRAA